MISITLPLPAKDLSPNARTHWAKKSKAVKNARLGARLRALAALNGSKPPRWEAAETRTVFYFPDARRRDRDNAQASLKQAWDGIADAGIVANDSGFIHHAPEMRVDAGNPRVEITIQEAP